MGLEGEPALLSGFSVKNYRNFIEEVVFQFDELENYPFGLQAVRDQFIKTCLLYGKNGSGKTNIGHALMDITSHLTDKSNWNYIDYSFDSYHLTSFRYTFAFQQSSLIYKYYLDHHRRLKSEELTINGTTVASYDHDTHQYEVRLKGTESLKAGLKGRNISFIKYIYKNSVLIKDSINEAFNSFMSYVENMSYISLKELCHAANSDYDEVTRNIVSKGKVEEFERLIKKIGFPHTFYVKQYDGVSSIYFDLDGRPVRFFGIASSGLCAFALLYSTLIDAGDQLTMLYIDELDGFLHYQTAQLILKELLLPAKAQIIMSTHQTALLNHNLLRPDCFFHLADGKIKPFTQLTDKQLRQAHNVERMYKAGSFDR